MNILIVGGSGSLTARLIKAFNKEGHRVSVLTGSYHAKSKYPHVFERYDFPYSSELLPEIFDSAAPDVTIFLGAYDPNFAWLDKRHDSVSYVSSVMNIMTAFSGIKRGRFIYVSSDAVFTPGFGSFYVEDDEPSASDVYGSALSQAEDIAKRFMSDPDLDIIIARLSGYYHFPKKAEDVEDAVSELCISYLRTGHVKIDRSRLIMPIYESDAEYFILKLALCTTHTYSCYHVSSGVTYSFDDVLAIIGETAEKCGYVIPSGDEEEKDDSKRHKGLFSKVTGHVEIGAEKVAEKLRSSGDNCRRSYLENQQSMLDIRRYRDEFGINRLADFSAQLTRIVEHIIKNKEDFLGIVDTKSKIIDWLKEKFGWAFHALVPYVENFISFIPFFMLNNRAVGSKYFARIDFYLLYVLLFAVLYGQHQATLSALLATLGFLYRQMYDKTGGEVLLDYNTYVWIAQLFIVGLTVGYLKDRLFAQKSEALEDHEHMAKQVDDIREINGSNVRVKDALQTQLINQDDSIGKIYEITSTLERYSSEEVLFYAADILRQIMGSEDIALYRVANASYARLFTATSELSRSLGKSVKYDDLGDLYDDITSGRPFINRKLTKDLPMMASGVYEGNELKMIIMIWKLPWEKMTLGQSNILTVTVALIQNAVLRANQYLEVLHAERYVDDTHILKRQAFEEILNVYRTAAERKLTEFSMYRATGSDGESPKELGIRLQRLLRLTDYVGIGEDDNVYFLLTNTAKHETAPAIDRIEAAGIKTDYTIA